MIVVAYDRGFEPPAPILTLRLSGTRGWVQLAGLVDTGADVTLVPADVAERHLPIAGTLDIRGVTGAVETVPLYRALFEIAGRSILLLVAGFGRETIIGRDLLNRLRMTLDGPGLTTSVG